MYSPFWLFDKEVASCMFLEESLYVVEAARLALHSDECLKADVSKSRDRDCILVRNVHGSRLLH